jgi:8-oxo-dGTP pyrophosphatase MutT (NUDIX family)
LSALVTLGVVGYGFYINASHQRTAKKLGFEGVGTTMVVSSRTDPGDMRLVAYVGDRVVNKDTGEKKRVLSVPGGKVEFWKDVLATLIWRPLELFKSPQYALAEQTAVREYKEETRVGIKPSDLFLVRVTGHGETTTGKPVYLFQAVREVDLDDPDWKESMLPAKTKDFYDVVMLPWPLTFGFLEQFRGFNKKILASPPFMDEDNIKKVKDFKAIEKKKPNERTPEERIRYQNYVVEIDKATLEVQRMLTPERLA